MEVVTFPDARPRHWKMCELARFLQWRHILLVDRVHYIDCMYILVRFNNLSPLLHQSIIVYLSGCSYPPGVLRLSTYIHAVPPCNMWISSVKDTHQVAQIQWPEWLEQMQVRQDHNWLGILRSRAQQCSTTFVRRTIRVLSQLLHCFF